MQTKEEYNAYHKIYQLARYHRRRAEAVEKLGRKCVQCGSTEDLHLDHIDPSTKTFDIGAIGTHSETKWQTELAKCQLLCKPHHQIKSVLEQGYNLRNVHGTEACYRHGKCRCDSCRKAHSDYGKERRQLKKGVSNETKA